jgi:hypothetical protein
MSKNAGGESSPQPSLNGKLKMKSDQFIHLSPTRSFRRWSAHFPEII